MNRRSFMGASMAAMMSGAARGAPDGFYAPAEEAPHARTWMCWPSRQEIYGPSRAYFEDLQQTVGRLAAAIAIHEPVTMLAEASAHAQVAELCGSEVTLLDTPTDDMWARDSGPVFLRDAAGAKRAVDFNFNGWGGRQVHGRDGHVAAAIAQAAGCEIVSTKLVGEGGGVEYDGDGALLLTDSCWVNDNRNPGLSQAEIEAELKALLGVEKVLWLPGVRGRDITDGHIDGSVRVVRPGMIMMSGYPGDDTDWGAAYRESKAILAAETDARGRRFDIAEIPAATDPRSTHPEMFTSYANYYVGNGALYTPEFGDEPADARAQESLARLYPNRRIVALQVDRIYESGGGIHCVTQQEPA